MSLRALRPYILAIVLTLPGLALRFAHPDLSPIWVAVLSGIAILGASFLLTWACEVAQLDIPQAVAVAVVAFIAVLPEYAVDMYFTWMAGQHPESAYSHYAIANMTGANRLLIGVGWSAIVLIFAGRYHSAVALHDDKRTDALFLGLATLYALLIPLKGSLTWVDGVVFLAIYAWYIWIIARRPCEEEQPEGPAAVLAQLPKKRRLRTVIAIFLFAALVILCNAEPFSESLVASGKLLGVNKPFLYEVVDTVVHENEGHYPELRERQAYITKVIRVEEENFAKTIDGGLKIFGEMLEGHKARGEKTFSGADAFKLYDTYGFPIDLTIEMVEDEGMELDKAAFDTLMEEQKTRARKAREALGDLGWAGVEFGKDMPATQFLGYESHSAQGKVLALVAGEELREELGTGAEGILVLDQTPFYAEMGGQVADHGVVENDGFRFQVSDVQKNKGGKYMHYGRVLSGNVKVGDTVTASIDAKRRRAIQRAHTATHLLHKALQTVLGDHVHQAGSLVEPDFLRFDFTHFSAMTPEELSEVNRLVNESILEGYPVDTKVMDIEEAKKTGATALFGEKYGDTVRVVDMGGYSVEFCGGTHLDNTAKAGVFHISSEFSVASGVRRIEATTGQALSLIHI